MSLSSFEMNGQPVGIDHPTYLIADIGANHDGDLIKAKELIQACAESGADSVKFQNFEARTIVSEHGFNQLKGDMSHQAKWKKPVYDVYEDAELSYEWTKELKEACDKCGVDYFTTPYSRRAIEEVNPYVSAWKIGSGDITWIDNIKEVAGHGKPVILATGASTIDEVELAYDAIRSCTDQYAVLQCNTNYTASVNEDRETTLKRMASVNLRVLETYKKRLPDALLGLSDHTIGHTTVVGAVGLFDARVIEKHFTIDNLLEGPDHAFAMNPTTWRNMVDAVREVEDRVSADMDFNARMKVVEKYVDMEELNASLGDGVKRIEENERQSKVVQRRGLCAATELKAGSVITEESLIPLRPELGYSLRPFEKDQLIGKTLKSDKVFGEAISLSDIK